jgi:CRISPR/Cas system-associated exonuclease Cas4 (RecB family)
VLAGLLGRDPDEIRGRARYLLDTNPHLERTLRARGRRWHRKWFSADGLVDPDPATRAHLAKHRLGARSYSPTALQNWASCPYRFFLQAIHRLRPRDGLVWIEEIDPLTRGSLVHEVQFRLFTKLQAEDGLPFDASTLDDVMAELDAVLSEVETEYREQLAPAIDRVWKRGIEAIRTDLRGWLRDSVRRNESWTPERFEFAFGMPAGDDRDPTSTTEPAVIAHGFQLRGSVDLIERHDDGELRVTDYKTGRVPYQRPQVVGGGEHLQPMLYALAVESITGETVHSGQLYYVSQRGGYGTIEISLNDKTRERTLGVLERIDRAVEDGFLPQAPRERACDWCDYRSVCGPNVESRLRFKEPDRLVDLFEVRGFK